ncbi:MAG: redoxin domain-containing protein [Caldithrix sp.]|nr:redoxin domain-containing protein [Caldithrix sp.]
MRSTYLIGLLLLFILAISCEKDTKRSIIRGQLDGADGQPPELAHVHMIELGGNPFESVVREKVDKDGYFAIKTPEGRYWELLITAVDHHPLRIPLIDIKPEQALNVSVSLQPHDYLTDFKDVRIIGDWNDFDFDKANYMRPRMDGSFWFRKKSPNDTMAYQLVGVETNNRSVNGTMADYHVYDGGGDYVSVVRTKDGFGTVIFNPDDVIRSKKKDLPKISFEPKQKDIQELIAIRNRVLKTKNEVTAALEIYRKLKRGLDAFSYDASEVLSFLKEKMNSENKQIAKFAALNLMELMYLHIELKPETYERIIDLVPLEDPMWDIKPMMIVDAFSKVKKDQTVDYLRNNFNRIASHKAQAVVLVELGFWAKKEDKVDELHSIYNRLKNEYDDFNEIDYYVNQLNPASNVTEGKAVPDFEVQLLDEEKSLTNEDLQGSYYLIDFWATWCKPCVNEMPVLHRVYEQFKDHNFKILSMSFDKSVKDVEKFRDKEWRMPWLHVYLEGEKRRIMSDKFEIAGIPKPILIDPEGIIIATEAELRGQRLEETLKKYLGDG